MIAFVRHGQTDLNRGGRLQGRLDAPLSDLGKLQAAALGRGFATQPVTRVLSSPLARAYDTGHAISTEHDLEVEIDERLIELDYGDWDGLALGDVPAESWAAWRVDPDFAPPGGERLSDVSARVRAFCADYLSVDLVIAVSHVSPIKAAVCIALQVDERVTWRMQLDVAAVSRIGARPDGTPYLATFNDASLAAAARI
ncbi:MAG: alpha-ribazole phosphatase [Actinomycetota bacterium]|nr:alpha-ribazole phosphatase [Actinomycetota bacterium]